MSLRKVFLFKENTQIGNLIVRDDGHYDVHGITPQHLQWLSQQPEVLAAKGPVTLTLPPELSDLSSALVGPMAGDEPVSDTDAYYSQRQGRAYNSRMKKGAQRKSRQITAIVTPDKETGKPFLVTAFGGPLADREIDDPYMPDEKTREASRKFWSQHALLSGED